MSSDPQEDVAQRLDELEATVRGLTKELVEANERIRQLEDRREAPRTGEESGAGKPMADEGNVEASDDPEDEEDDPEDIIVA